MTKIYVFSGTSLVLEAVSSELVSASLSDLRVEVPKGWVAELSDKNRTLSVKPFEEEVSAESP